MSDKHLKSPDENFSTTGKDTTRNNYLDRNTMKPDEVRPKGEIIAHHHDHDDEDEEDDDEEDDDDEE